MFSRYVNNQVRIRASLDFDWRFTRGDIAGAEKVTFDDGNWKTVGIPHDWSIEGPFNKDNPCGGAGGYLPGGIGWYRKSFQLSEDYRDKKVFVEFDGVYMNSDVWINGHHLGNHPCGYTSFYYDVTPYLNHNDSKNILAVKVDNLKQPNSRWYSGSGIYRHMWLLITDRLHVEHWGTFITTPKVSEESAIIEIKTRVKNENDLSRRCLLITALVDKDGEVLRTIRTSHDIPAKSEYEFVQRVEVKNPNLWSPDNPYLYAVYSRLEDGGTTVDDYETTLGIKEFHFDADRGFFLNDKNLKIKGACLHHDCGCLGAACPDRAKERQLEILKKMGCNAIRTSHNPPSPVLLDYCDRHGLLVMDEAFDVWKEGKGLGFWRGKRNWKYGYHRYFEEWGVKDLKSMIYRDRNHPSVIMWSVGNEIPEQLRPEGVEILEKLVEVVHKEDPTRPATCACNKIEAANKTGFSDLLDVVGYNYGERFYDKDHLSHPDRKIIGSENRSASPFEARGIYHMSNMSSDKRICEAENSWKITKKKEFVAGLFIWTGFDYIGEPTPYLWPARSSYFGVIDLCGFPKDAFYFYQSQWTDEPMIHIFPHWNWQGKEGKAISVWCYTNCDSVELFLNGKSLGVKDCGSRSDLHLSWDVPYEPGTLKAIGKKSEKIVCAQEIHTAGEPAKIVLTPDKDTLIADGQDISYVTVTILDNKGNLVPDANNLVTFDIEGKGEILGVDNGDPVSHEDFKSNYRRAFNGLCLVVVQSICKPGQIRLTATSVGLVSSSITLTTLREKEERSVKVKIESTF